MPDIDPKVIANKLSIDPNHVGEKKKKKKRHTSNATRYTAICDKVDK